MKSKIDLDSSIQEKFRTEYLEHIEPKMEQMARQGHNELIQRVLAKGQNTPSRYNMSQMTSDDGRD